MTSEWFLLCQWMCACEEVRLLSNSISRNFEKSMFERHDSFGRDLWKVIAE